MNPDRAPDAGRNGPSSDDARSRELKVAREISECFLTATTPLEVYRHALARVTPLVGASFASVFLRDEEDPGLLRLACAHSWPQASARYLSDLRIREGRGPTGQAVGRRESVAVEDVFESAEYQEWWEPARELSFVSMIALPLIIDVRALGAVSFYFSERRQFGDEERSLLGVVAHQLAMTAERAQLAAELRPRDRPRLRTDEGLRRATEAESTLEGVRRAREIEDDDAPLRPPPSGTGPESR